MSREDEIRELAYSLWEKDGRLDGKDQEYWFKATQIWEEQQKTKSAAESLRQAAENPYTMPRRSRPPGRRTG